MGRRSSGGGGGRSSYRPAAKNPPPRQPAAAPAARPTNRGGFGEAVAEGIGFGAGHAAAHRAVDAVVGPRTIQHTTVPAAAADTCSLQTRAFQDVTHISHSHTSIRSSDIKRCLASNMSDIGQCQIYLDTWAACKRSHSSL